MLLDYRRSLFITAESLSQWGECPVHQDPQIMSCHVMALQCKRSEVTKINAESAAGKSLTWDSHMMSMSRVA